MILLSAGMLLIALVAFAWKLWLLEQWPRTEGSVVSAHVVDSIDQDAGVKTCSAVYEIRYAVAGRDFSIEDGGHTFSNDCTGVQADVGTAPGRKVFVLYERDDPRVAYANPGFNISFFLLSFLLAMISAAFALAGWFAWKLGSWMDRRGIVLP